MSMKRRHSGESRVLRAEVVEALLAGARAPLPRSQEFRPEPAWPSFVAERARAALDEAFLQTGEPSLAAPGARDGIRVSTLLRGVVE